MAKLLVVLVALFGCAFAAPSLRVVNGTDASPGEFPFAVSLRNNLRHTCGGTILNNRRILTAAHCVCQNNVPNNPSTYTIQYGSVDISETTERSIQVLQIHCHDFVYDTLVNDVAVLELATAIPDDGTWEAVTLDPNFDTSMQGVGVAIGWGRLWHEGPIPTRLQKITVDIYSDLFCNLRFDATQHICFGATLGGVCNGDSGTCLLATNKQQIGIASFITNTCGIANVLTPNVYARVSKFYEWIQEKASLN